MQTDQRPHALRVAGRYAKDTYARLKAWYKGSTDEEITAWLNEHHPWAIPMINQAIADAIAKHRAQQEKEARHE